MNSSLNELFEGKAFMLRRQHIQFMKEAIKEARKGLREGGIPIGSVLVKDGKIIGRGHNRRVQKDSAILHAEMDCIENAGRLKAKDYEKCVIYSTLSPCAMCTGAILLYKIPAVVIGENKTFKGPEAYSKKRGVRLINLNLSECKKMMEDFITSNPKLWNEDIGE
jgi:cytosine deaminase